MTTHNQRVEKRLKDLEIEFTEVLFVSPGRWNPPSSCRFCDGAVGSFYTVGYRRPDGQPDYSSLICRDFNGCDARRFQKAVQT